MGKISVETDEVFRVSLPGKEVNSTTLEDFAVHSGFDYPKIEEDLVGIVDYTVPLSTAPNTYTVATINHNLGYIPCTQCFVQDIDGVSASQFAMLPDSDGYSGNHFTCYATTTQFVIQYIVTDDEMFPESWPGYDFKFKYQIWVND